MSVFPNFSNVPTWVKAEIENRKANPMIVNGLNAWVRIASGVDKGLVMYSNPNFSLFEAGGDGYVGSIYGSRSQSGTIGTTWGGAPIVAGDGDIGFRPRPTITSIEIDEGAGSLSRKSNFTITCYTLAQLDVVCKYFLEPGFTVFLEWGWNRKDSLIGFKDLSVPYVSQFQNFKEVNNRRSKTKGNYDNYLGFITGGGIDIGDSTWDVKVELTGFTELPAYFMASDVVYDENGNPKEKEENSNTFPPLSVSSAKDLGQKRFMMMFNQLPTNRRSGNIANFVKNKEIANPVNFINFDDSVKDALNDVTDGSLWGLVDNNVKVEKKGEEVEFPSGTKIIDDNKFIRFGVLMDIMNEIGVAGYKIGDKFLNFRINTKNTAVGAFPQIFSANKAKLFIPNPKTPKFDLIQAATKGQPQNVYVGESNNTIIYNDKKVFFPSDKPIQNGVSDKKILFYKESDTTSINVDAEYWGYLDDLYVNFDFAKGIMETKNFYIKDALYQILNGMASAAGGIWDFQIIENSTTDGNNVELRVIDMNLMDNKYEDPTVTFEVFGTDSVFMDASLDLSIGGAKMNQIIGQRLKAKVNPSQATVVGNLFAKGLTDQVLTEIRRVEAIPFSQAAAETGGTGDAEEEQKLKERNLETFLQKVGIYPKVELTKLSDLSKPVTELTYVASLDDLALFDSKKAGFDRVVEGAGGTSTLFPINFSFTIHGVSGIKRGDKFKIRGIPKSYSEGGFFQVLSVKQIIDGMTWKTEVTGGFRQQLAKSKK